MKLMIIVILARYFSIKDQILGYNLKELMVPFALLGVPVLLIMKQPDLGTSMLVIFIASTMALFAGIRRRTLFVLGFLGMAAAAGGSGSSFR